MVCPDRPRGAGRIGPLACAALLLLAAGGSPIPARAQGRDDLRELLMRISTGGRRIGYVGRKVVIDFSREAPAITHFQVTHRMPGMERREYPDRGRVVVTRGGWRWEYDPGRKVVVKRPAPTEEGGDLPQRENLELVLRNYRVQLSEGMPILGRQSTLVQFEPVEPGSRPSRKIWVDTEKGLPLRGEVYGIDGALSHLSLFELLSYRDDLEDGLFQVDVPGARVLEMPRGTGGECRMAVEEGPGEDLVWRPRQLPGGYELMCRRRGEHRGKAEYQQVFTDGLSSLSLFQSEGERVRQGGGERTVPVKVGANPGELHDFGLLKLVTWNDAGRHFVLVGELSREKLLQVAGSLGPPAARRTKRP